MHAQKKDVITQLQKDISFLQGFKPALAGTAPDLGLGPIAASFPNACFPLGVVHEFLCAKGEEAAATAGFISGLLGGLMKSSGAALWISSSRMLFPPALKSFGIEPDQIIFIDLQNDTDILWAMEEALKCTGLSAVIGEMRDISFTASRRLQLAVEQSRVTGFIVHRHPLKLNITACASRWKILPIPTMLEDDLPGVGFPRWKVELLKSRNGKPGTWEVEWVAGRFRHTSGKITSMPLEQKKKTG